MMIVWASLVAAVVLSIERIAYILIWRHPDSFASLCKHPALAAFGGSVDALEKLFYLFKLLQFSIFAGWCVLFSEADLPLPSGTALSTTAGGILILSGQILNLSVFYRLGKTGVFYGNRFGYEIPWCVGFPFSMFKHPQYVGTLISIWGFFLMMRFPYADWVIIPLIETLYYWLGARYER